MDHFHKNVSVASDSVPLSSDNFSPDSASSGCVQNSSDLSVFLFPSLQNDKVSYGVHPDPSDYGFHRFKQQGIDVDIKGVGVVPQMPIAWALKRDQIPVSYLNYEEYAPPKAKDYLSRTFEHLGYTAYREFHASVMLGESYMEHHPNKDPLSPFREVTYGIRSSPRSAIATVAGLKPVLDSCSFSENLLTVRIRYAIDPEKYATTLRTWQIDQHYYRLTRLPRSEPQMSSLPFAARIDIPTSTFAQVVTRELRPVRVKMSNDTRYVAMMRKISCSPSSQPSTPRAVQPTQTYGDVLKLVYACRNAAGRSDQEAAFRGVLALNPWRSNQFDRLFFGSLYLNKAAKIVLRRFNFNVPDDWTMCLDYSRPFDQVVMHKLIARQSDIDVYLKRRQEYIGRQPNNSQPGEYVPRSRPQMDCGSHVEDSYERVAGYLEELPPPDQKTSSDPTKSTVNKFLGILFKVFQQFFEVLKEFFQDNPWVHHVMLVIVACLFIKRMSSVPNWLMFGLLYFKGTRTVLGVALFEIMKNLWDLGQTGVHAQGPFTWIAFAASAILMRRFPIGYRIINHTRFVAGLEALLEGTKGALENLVNMVLSCFTEHRVRWTLTENAAVNKWLIDAEKFARVMSVDGSPDPANNALFHSYIAEGHNLRALYKSTDVEYARIGKVLDKLDATAKLFPAFTFPGQIRMEPVGIMLSGETRIGKSTLAAMLAKTIVAVVMKNPNMSTAEMEKHIYQMTASNFADGYSNQLITAFDDFLQKFPSPNDQQSEIMNLIRGGNQWPWPLDMAALPLKGRFHFCSSFLLATSNLKSLDFLTKVMVSPLALVSRLPHWYEVTRKNPDIPLSPDCDPDETWVFQKLTWSTSVNGATNAKTPMTSVPVGDPINFTELVRVIINDYRARSNFFEARTVNDRSVISRTYASVVDQQPDPPGPTISSDSVEPTQSSAPPPDPVTVVRAEGLFTPLTVAAAGLLFLPRMLASHVVRQGFHTAKDEIQVLGKSLRKNAFRIAACGLAIIAVIKLCKKAISEFGKLFGIGKKDRVNISTVKAEIGETGDEVLDRIARNQFLIAVRTDQNEPGLKAGYGLALDDNTIAIPHHFKVEANRRHAKLFALAHDVVLKLENLKYEDPVTDIAIYSVKTFRPSIWCHIGRPNPATRCYMVNMENTKLTTVHKYGSTVYEGTNVQRNLVAHDASTTQGDCGSFLIAIDKRNTARLVGFHVAGRINGIGHGFFSPLCHLLTKAEFHGHEFIGKVEPIHNGSRQPIEKTPYAGLLREPVGGPAVLRPVLIDGIKVDPIVKGIASCARVQHAPPKDYVDVVNVVVREIFEFFDPAKLVSITDAEAAAGVPGERFQKGVARNKSPGYPLCREFQNKRPIYGASGPYDTDNPNARRVVQMANQLAQSYVDGTLVPYTGLPGAVFRDVGKAEVRSEKKIASADTRLISAAPLEYVILVRRHFSGFVSEYMLNRQRHGGMIGVNPYSGEAALIHRRSMNMNKQGLGFSGDFAAFDKSQNYFIMKAIWQAICNNMPEYPKHAAVFDGIGRDTYSALHLGGDSYVSDTVYRASGSMPSGHPLTSVLNSIYNKVVFRLAWVHKYGLKRVGDFRNHVDLAVYGDDNRAAPDDKHLDFHLEYMHDYCRDELHIEYTSETKDGVLYKLKPLSECGFIKRKFVERDGYVYAQLELKSIEDMFNWKMRKTDAVEHLRAVTNAALMELSAYPFPVFKERLEKIQACWQQHGISDAVLTCGARSTYNIYNQMYLQYEPVWSSDVGDDV